MGPLSSRGFLFFDLFYTLSRPARRDPVTEFSILGLTKDEWNRYAVAPAVYTPRATGKVTDPIQIIDEIAATLPFPVSKETRELLLKLRVARMRTCLTEIPDSVLGTLQRLKSSGKRLCLLSNADAIDTQGWPDSPLRPLMEQAVFSWQAGVMKPDPAIYTLAAERMGARPEECIFIGDGSFGELAGAKAAGFAAIMTEEFDVKPEPSRMEMISISDAVIGSFPELIPLLTEKEA